MRPSAPSNLRGLVNESDNLRQSQRGSGGRPGQLVGPPRKGGVSSREQRHYTRHARGSGDDVGKNEWQSRSGMGPRGGRSMTVPGNIQLHLHVLH